MDVEVQVPSGFGRPDGAVEAGQLAAVVDGDAVRAEASRRPPARSRSPRRSRPRAAAARRCRRSRPAGCPAPRRRPPHTGRRRRCHRPRAPGHRDPTRARAPPNASRPGRCRRRWQARRLGTRRQGHEHRLGERDPHEVALRHAPVAGRSAPFRAARPGRDTAGREPPPATRTRAAADLERDDHAVALADRPDPVRHVGDLGDELVTGERYRQRRLPGHHGRAEVTGGDGERAHQRAPSPVRRGAVTSSHSSLPEYGTSTGA